MGKIYREPVVLLLSLAGQHALLPVRQQGLPRVRGKARAVRHAARGGDPADVLRAAAEIPSRRAGPVRRPTAVIGDRPGATRKIFRSVAVLVRAAGERASVV